MPVVFAFAIMRLGWGYDQDTRRSGSQLNPSRSNRFLIDFKTSHFRSKPLFGFSAPGIRPQLNSKFCDSHDTLPSRRFHLWPTRRVCGYRYNRVLRSLLAHDLFWARSMFNLSDMPNSRNMHIFSSVSVELIITSLLITVFRDDNAAILKILDDDMPQGNVLNVTGVQLPIFTRSPTLNGLKMTKNIPLMMLENALWEQNRQWQRIPAPVRMVFPKVQGPVPNER